MVDTADRYFDEAKDEYNLVQKRAKLQQTYESTQDMHLLYMHARQIEALNNGPNAVRRIHRGRR